MIGKLEGHAWHGAIHSGGCSCTMGATGGRRESRVSRSRSETSAARRNERTISDVPLSGPERKLKRPVVVDSTSYTQTAGRFVLMEMGHYIVIWNGDFMGAKNFTLDDFEILIASPEPYKECIVFVETDEDLLFILSDEQRSGSFVVELPGDGERIVRRISLESFRALLDAAERKLLELDTPPG